MTRQQIIDSVVRELWQASHEGNRELIRMIILATDEGLWEGPLKFDESTLMKIRAEFALRAAAITDTAHSDA